MHELPLTEQIIKIAEQSCRENGGDRVTSIRLVIGEDSGFIGDSIQMYFDIISQGSLCEGATISMERIRPQLQCTQCGAHFYRTYLSFDCPDCGGQGRPTQIGKECYVDSVEIQ